MENKGLAIIGMILTLLLGLFAGAVLFSSTETVIEDKVCPIVKPIVCDELVVCDDTVVTEAASTESDLDLAKRAFLKAVEDEEDEAGNEVDILKRYDFDEMSVRSIGDAYNVSIDDEITTVDFTIKVKFKEDDDKSVRKEYAVTVVFEDDEDTLVNATKII